ncbi:MAG TPA: peptide deformylase [Phycisphaerae bacterium]|nr:peptide deformylase [Phycisphaerae bacterium]HNU43972.1 peptide deformylase [Phycisphaerae bacterium]
MKLDKLRIVHHPDPALHVPCAPVTEFGPDLARFAQRLLELMRTGEGVGLAAPQVGVNQRIFVCNVTGEPGDDFVCVNPRFVALDGSAEAAEGCLSLPGVTVTMRRAAQVVLEGFDPEGNPIRREGSELTARVWQHEADHLEGRLIIDRMGDADEIANRRAIRQMVEDYQRWHRRPARKTV